MTKSKSSNLFGKLKKKLTYIEFDEEDKNKEIKIISDIKLPKSKFMYFFGKFKKNFKLKPYTEFEDEEDEFGHLSSGDLSSNESENQISYLPFTN